MLDVQMPGMDGFEVAETISGYSKTKDIPIIFLSAVNTDKKSSPRDIHPAVWTSNLIKQVILSDFSLIFMQLNCCCRNNISFRLSNRHE